MRKLLITSALALAVMGAAGAAYASKDDLRVNVPRDQWMTVAQVAEKVAAQGYDIRKIEAEKGGYEVEVVAKDGRRLELFVHPATGETLRSKIDD